MTSEKLYESFCQKTTFKKTARHYNSRYFCDFKKLFQKTCHDHAGFVLCLLLFFLFYRQKDASGRPGPAKPLLLPGNDPKSFCKCFSSFLRSPRCGLLHMIFKDFGIHQRLFEETSLKASILPRRSGRSPLQYAAASFPKMSLKGVGGWRYTQLTVLNYILLKSFENCLNV